LEKLLSFDLTQWSDSCWQAVRVNAVGIYRTKPRWAKRPTAPSLMLTRHVQNPAKPRVQVAPGIVWSETAAANYTGAHAGLLDKFRPTIPAKRLGRPTEISAAVCFLLSPAAAYITGAVLPVDGGASVCVILFCEPSPCTVALDTLTPCGWQVHTSVGCPRPQRVAPGMGRHWQRREQLQSGVTIP
jgi:hypothetical protein